MEKKWRVSIIVAVVALLVCVATTTFAFWDKTKVDFNLDFNVGDRLIISNEGNVSSDLATHKLVPAGAIKGVNDKTSLLLASPFLKLTTSVADAEVPVGFMVKYSYTVKLGDEDKTSEFKIVIKNGDAVIETDTNSNLLASLAGTSLNVYMEYAKSAAEATPVVFAGKALSVAITFTIVATEVGG